MTAAVDCQIAVGDVEGGRTGCIATICRLKLLKAIYKITDSTKPSSSTVLFERESPRALKLE